ncbi:hypothetical protein OQA88_3237 [Cercophora sp. LCS_1]
MSRWHLTTCQSPSVTVQADSNPKCATCGAVPDVAGLASQKRDSSASPPFPPDEKPGQLNLYWPSSVPYVSATLGGVEDSHGKVCKPPESGDSAAEGGCTPSLPAIIHGNRLKPDEFRLVCLPGTSDNTLPIHVELETHNYERYPDYEAVSYAWGGEDGDSSATCPLFVGPFWDLLLITKNCWSMLRALRPWRGLRLIWVDAICINQSDTTERDEQVAKMTRIYRNCSQVVVHLGEDLVPLPEPHRYPQKQKLEFAASQYAQDFYNLLERRYFGRVWIIQELVLPRQVSIPIRNFELVADRDTAKDGYWRNQLTARNAWIAHIASGQARDRDIFQVMRETFRSDCTDPRDQIFGVLALLGQVDTAKSGAHDLQPNYSLSRLQVFIGIFAYTLLRLKRTELFYHSAGVLGAHETSLSWLPDWTTRDHWKSWIPTDSWRKDLILNLERQIYQNGAALSEARRKQGVAWQYRSLSHLDKSASPFCTDMYTPLHVSPESRAWRADYELQQDQEIADWPYDTGVPPEYFDKPIDEEYDGRAYKELPWFKDAAVDSGTGSLSINLSHLFKFSVVPTLVPPLHPAKGNSGPKVFEIPGAKDQLRTPFAYLVTESPLDRPGVLSTELDHLFLLDQGNSSPLIYLILRQIQPQNRTYRLVGSACHLCFAAPRDFWTRRAYNTSSETWIKFPDVRFNNFLYLSALQRAVSTKILEVKGFLRRKVGWHDEPRIDALCLEKTMFYPWDMIRAFQGLLDEDRGKGPGFLETYTLFLQQRGCKVQLPKASGDDRDTLVVALDADQLEAAQSIPMLEHLFEFRKIRLTRRWRWSTPRAEQPATPNSSDLTCTRAKLGKFGRGTNLYEVLKGLSYISSETGESETAMVLREVDIIDHLAADSTWPKSIVSGFNIDGRTFRVNIV